MAESNNFWRDGLLHHNKEGISENGPTFTGEWAVGKRLLGSHVSFVEEIMAITKDNVYRAMTLIPNDDPEQHFSHDNMTGLYCMALADLGTIPNEFPTFKWNNRYWLHPRDIIFYNVLKERKWSYLLLPILLFISLLSCIREERATSGKCLVWMRLNALKLHSHPVVQWFGTIGMKLCTKLIKRVNGSWGSVFAIYFKDVMHPIHNIIRSLDAK